MVWLIYERAKKKSDSSPIKVAVSVEQQKEKAASLSTTQEA